MLPFLLTSLLFLILHLSAEETISTVSQRPPSVEGNADQLIQPRSQNESSSQWYDHGDATDHEQYFLELVNQARANPDGEAARLELGLNDGLSDGTISSIPKPPLAFNRHLIHAARDHSQWMLDSDRFNHTGLNESSPKSRMQEAGYIFSGGWSLSENIAWRGTTGTPYLTAYVPLLHEQLFRSPGHRKNLMSPGYQEIGLGLQAGQFKNIGKQYNSVMITQDFARSGDTPGPFLLGVIYRDENTNGRYDPGEGVGGVTVQPASGQYHAISSSAGGYAMPYSSSGTMQVTFSGEALSAPVVTEFDRSGDNVKFDLELNGLKQLKFIAGTLQWSPLDGFRARIQGPNDTSVILQSSVDQEDWTDVNSYVLNGGYADVHDVEASLQFRLYRLRVQP